MHGTTARRILTAVLAASAVMAAGRAMAQPAIEASEGAHFSLGTISKGDVISHVVTLRNTGKDTLRVSHVDVSCGCTGSMLSSDRIAPGSSGTLSITFNSRNFKGPIHKTVTVNSNAANQPAMVIEFDGTVAEDIGVSPDYIWFQHARVGEPSENPLTVKNEGTTPFTLTGFETDVDGVSAVFPPAPIPPGGSATVTVRYTPPKAVQIISGKLSLSTSHPHQKELVIGVYGSTNEGK